MVKRPFVVCALACLSGCMAGILIHFYLSFDCIKSLREQKIAVFFLLCIFCIVFYTIAYLWEEKQAKAGRQGLLQASHYPLYFLVPFTFLFSLYQYCIYSIPGQLEQYITAQGGVIEEINVSAVVYRVKETDSGGQIYLKKLVIKDESGKTADMQGDLLLYFTGTCLPVPGNTISFDAKLKQFDKPSNPGQYNGYMYQKIRGVYAMAYAKDYIVTDNHIDIVAVFFQVVRRRFADIYDRVFSEKDASVMKAMVLGDKGDLNRDLKALYSENGIAHILAISGLHISLLGMCILSLLRQTPLPRAISIITAGLFVLAYGRMTEFGVSASRAILMFLLSISGEMAGRTYDFLTGISMAVLFVLLKNPLYIYDSGFLLSFGAVCGIAVIHPILKETFLPGRARLNFFEGIFDSLLISISVSLATLPAIVSMYFSYPFYGVLLNILILPLMQILLPAGILAGIAGFVSGTLAAVPASIAHMILFFYEKICHIVSDLPYAMQLTGDSSIRQVMIYYILLAAALLLWKYKNSKLPYLMLPLAVITLYRTAPSGLRIHFLDVGQGDCCIMEFPDGQAMMVDSGSSSVSAVGTYRVMPFLKASRIANLELVFLTHMDSDHINAVQEILEESAKKNKKAPIIKNLAVPALLKDNETWLELKKLAKKCGTNIFYIRAGDDFAFSGAQLQCLYPEEKVADNDANACSLVLSIHYGNFDLLLTGDVTGAGETYLMEHCSEQLSGIDVLKAAHHGSQYSTPAEFLEICRPELTIISCGKDNRYGHPHKETLQRLQEAGSYILVTKDAGEIMLETEGNGYRVYGFNG